MPTTSPALHPYGKALAAALGLALALGCSLYKAQKAIDEGRYEEAVQAYRSMLQQDPTNVKAKLGYRRAAVLASQQHLEKARAAEKRNQRDVVFEEVRRALVLDPNNAVAADWMANLETEALREKEGLEREQSLELAKEEAEAIDKLQLNPRSTEGIDLTFESKTNLREIFKALSKATGINILYHKSFPDTQTSINLKGMPFQKALDTLMLQNDLFYKVLDPNTIMVFLSNTQNRDQHENMLLKTFYLSNSEPENVRNILQQMSPGMKLFVDKRLNAITVKAKRNDLSIAQQVVSQLDKAKAEVAVFLELLEVTENTMESVGLLPVAPAPFNDQPYRIGVTLDNIGSINQNKGAIRISKSDLRFLFPSLTLDALKSSGDAKLVASPNVRVLSGEKGEINIGDKISTTQSQFGAMGTSSIGTGTSTTGSMGSLAGLGLGGLNQSYGYEEVGVKITVEPRVHFNGDITVVLTADIKTLKSGSQAGRPDLGQRIIKTTARLRDGETAVFGGLLKEEEQKSLQGIWGITDLPVLGKLLGSNRKTTAKTDVLLTIRTVLVRRPDLSKKDFEAFDPDLAKTETGPFAPKKSPAKPEEPKPQAPPAQAPKVAPAKPQEAATPTDPPGVTRLPDGRIARAPRRKPGQAEEGAEGTKPSEGAKPGAEPAKGPSDAPRATGDAAPAATAPKTPSAPATDTPKPATPESPAEQPKTPETPARPDAVPASAEATPTKPSPVDPNYQELVLFIAPLTNQIMKGERIRLAIQVSGGKGVDAGSIELRIDPKLKLVGMTPGDFLTNEGGSFEAIPLSKDGLHPVTFKRNAAATDSGTLLFLDLEGVASGNAPVLIQAGRFLSGRNPLSGRWVNSLVVVE